MTDRFRDDALYGTSRFGRRASPGRRAAALFLAYLGSRRIEHWAFFAAGLVFGAVLT